MNLQQRTGRKPKPPLENGHTQHRIRIVEWVAWQDTYPDTGKTLSKAQHFYKIACDCGNTEIVTQCAIVAGKRECARCTKGRKNENKKKAYAPAECLPAELDFARMRLG